MGHARDALSDVAAAAVRLAEADYADLRSDDAVKMLIAARLFAGQVSLYLERSRGREPGSVARAIALSRAGGTEVGNDPVGGAVTRVADYGDAAAVGGDVPAVAGAVTRPARRY